MCLRGGLRGGSGHRFRPGGLVVGTLADGRVQPALARRAARLIPSDFTFDAVLVRSEEPRP